MFDDFDLRIQPEELFDEDELSFINVFVEDEDEEYEDEEYSLALEEITDDLEELFATQILENIGDIEEDTDEEEDFLPDDIDWEYELSVTYDLDESDILEVSQDFFNMLNED